MRVLLGEACQVDGCYRRVLPGTWPELCINRTMSKKLSQTFRRNISIVIVESTGTT